MPSELVSALMRTITLPIDVFFRDFEEKAERFAIGGRIILSLAQQLYKLEHLKRMHALHYNDYQCLEQNSGVLGKEGELIGRRQITDVQCRRLLALCLFPGDHCNRSAVHPPVILENLDILFPGPVGSPISAVNAATHGFHPSINAPYFNIPRELLDSLSKNWCTAHANFHEHTHKRVLRLIKLLLGVYGLRGKMIAEVAGCWQEKRPLLAIKQSLKQGREDVHLSYADKLEEASTAREKVSSGVTSCGVFLATIFSYVLVLIFRWRV